MKQDIEAVIVNMLLRAARRKQLIPYDTFHTTFAPATPLKVRYATLERAAASICRPDVADYGCLLSTASGLPGHDFFERFGRTHIARLNAIRGADSRRHLKLSEKRLFAREARRDVYRHYREELKRVKDICRDLGITGAGVGVLSAFASS